MGIETERPLELQCALGPDKLLIRHFEGTEYLGRGFEYTLMLYSLEHDIEMESLLGTHASVRVRTAQTERFFDGVVFEFAHIGNQRRYALYKMKLRPWLWVLAQSRDCRVYQNQTTPDIVKAIINEQGLGPIEEMLMNRYKPREYCVQYRESHLTFISRLLEDEGIYYYFKHEPGKHTLVLADSVSAHQPASGFEKLSFNRLDDDTREPGVFFNWSAVKRVQSGQVTLLDYDFEKPTADMRADSSDQKSHDYADGEWFEYPGHYKVVQTGDELARLRVEEHAANYEVAEGETDAVGLYTGALVTLADHPRKDQNREYLLIGMTYAADSGAFETGGGGGGRLIYQARTKAIDSKVQFRPQRTTRSPIIPGAQTATVVGPSDQEIWTDSFGRVKVQFHWDRRGKRDAKSSCFIRVAQSAAGARWGSIFIPRIGQEVVVEFLEGDPDQPLITGCLFNNRNRVPYELPKHQTQSGWKTQSSKGGSAEDYNELRFEDEKGAEEVVLHAQRDLSISVEHDQTNTTTNNLTLSVDEGYYATTVKTGYKRTEVPKNKSELFAKEIYEAADEKIDMSVGACRILIEPAQITISMAENVITLSAAGINISSNGASVIDCSPAGVAANGPMVKLNS